MVVDASLPCAVVEHSPVQTSDHSSDTGAPAMEESVEGGDGVAKEGKLETVHHPPDYVTGLFASVSIAMPNSDSSRMIPMGCFLQDDSFRMFPLR